MSVDVRSLHLTDLFQHFALAQAQRLQSNGGRGPDPANGYLEALLERFYAKSGGGVVRQALLDPYFPLGMIAGTMFADVVGMRFFINKRRPDLEAALARELLEWSQAFVQIRQDIDTFFDPQTITCIPLDGRRHPLPSDQWCRLCGVCCQIGGVPPRAPDAVRYPQRWHAWLAGDAVSNQQLCPFLFQFFGQRHFFCAIHQIKPLACRGFDRHACQQRRRDGYLHAAPWGGGFKTGREG